ncbi:MAG: ABC transporter permease [Candidatus Xenobia bacterium]
MRLALLVRAAWRSLWRNKVRTLLTMLGIIIGVAAIIAMVALGHGAQARTQAEMLNIGVNMLHVYSNPIRVNGVVKGDYARFSIADVEGIKAACPAVRYVSPQMWMSGHPAVYEDQTCTGDQLGVSPDFLAIHHRIISLGAAFTRDDVEQSTRVCVLGSKAADELFGNRNPVGREIRIRGVQFRVLGVMRAVGEDGGWFGDSDKMILIPYTAVLRYLYRSRRVYSINVAAAEPDQVPQVKEQVSAYLRQQHAIRASGQDDFRIFDVEAMLQRWKHQQQLFAGLLGGVASISLLVGGIGIMNIMLVTVTERIREIGIRMAVGARPFDILLQFFVEALTISVGGGLIGIALGLFVSHLMDEKWAAAIVSVDSILLACTASVAIGVFFGFYPAMRASRLDPIEALRHE